MKKLFFFRGVFFSGLKKSSELMTCALFQEKKNTQKFGRKKKHNQILSKKKSDFLKIRMNDRWTLHEKKNTASIFSPLREIKKNSILGF